MTQAPSASQRLYGLDALRGLAVLLMIEQHLGIWLWQGPANGESTYDYPALMAFNALGGGAAPLFVTLAGIGSALMVHKRRDKTATPSQIVGPVDLTLVRRGLSLIAFGLLLNLLTPSWFTWRSWFVLHLMGFGMLITPLLRRLSGPALFTLALATLVATPMVQHAWGTPLDLSNLRMSGVVHEARDGTRRFLPNALVRIATAEGQFPIFGWLSFFLSGLAAGTAIAAGDRRRPAYYALVLLAVGGCLALIGLTNAFEAGGFAHRATRVHIPFFPASPALLALLGGAVLIATYLVLRASEALNLHSTHPMVTLGRGSLTLLLVHVYVFRELSRPVGLWRALTASQALAMLGAFTVFCFVACWIWQRVDYRYGAEWILRKLAP